MKKYTTVSGDVWDLIAFKQMGSCLYMDQLINANRRHIKTTIFKAGVELVIPEVSTVQSPRLPPWRR